MIKFNTQPREGIGVGADMFVTPFVALDGTLAKPRVGANKSGTAITVATGGISLLVRSAMDRLAGSVDHCVETMPKFPQPPLPVDGVPDTPLRLDFRGHLQLNCAGWQAVRLTSGSRRGTSGLSQLANTRKIATGIADTVCGSCKKNR